MQDAYRKALGIMGCIAALVLCAAGGAQAQDYPTKQVRIVVPYPPGGFNDTLGRLAAKHLSERWKVPVIVDSRPGAGTMIGTREVAASAPDGATILVVQFPFATNPWLYKGIPYDTRKDFAPVMLAGQSPMLLITHAHSPYRTVADVVAAAKAKPDALSYGSSGPGSSNHLAMELFESVAGGLQMRQVPYKGSSPMLADLAGGLFDVAVDLLPNALAFLQSGRVRPLAIAAARRSPLYPDLPTMAEAGVPGFEATSWHGFVVRAGTPQPIIDKINRDLNAVLREPEVKKAFADQGVEPDGGTPAQFRTFIEGQMALWKKVVDDRHVVVE